MDAAPHGPTQAIVFEIEQQRNIMAMRAADLAGRLAAAIGEAKRLEALIGQLRAEVAIKVSRIAELEEALAAAPAAKTTNDQEP